VGRGDPPPRDRVALTVEPGASHQPARWCVSTHRE
jgi:hypothetical protein